MYGFVWIVWLSLLVSFESYIDSFCIFQNIKVIYLDLWDDCFTYNLYTNGIQPFLVSS